MRFAAGADGFLILIRCIRYPGRSMSVVTPTATLLLGAAELRGGPLATIWHRSKIRPARHCISRRRANERRAPSLERQRMPCERFAAESDEACDLDDFVGGGKGRG